MHYLMFSRIEVAKSTGSWDTRPRDLRSHERLSFLRSMPSSNTWPSSGS